MLSRLSVLCAGALLLASSSVHAATLTLSAETIVDALNNFGTLVDGGRTNKYSGLEVVKFTIGWDTPPTDGTTITLSCVDAAGLDLSDYLTTNGADGGAVVTISGAPASLANALTFPGRTTPVNRITDKLVTCTATSSDTATFPDPATFRFYLGAIVTLSDTVAAPAVPGSTYDLTATINPDWIIQWTEEGDASLNIACGGGALSASSVTFSGSGPTTPQTVQWTAPTIPQTPITCLYSGPRLMPTTTQTYGYLDFYNVTTAAFTMTLPTITVDAFTGVVTAGTNTPLTVTFSNTVNNLELTATCMAGGISVGAIPAVTVATGTTATFNIGASLTTAATGVTCSIARSAGDTFYTNALPASVGPFNVIVPAVSSSASSMSSSAAAMASSTSTNAGSSSAPAGGASSSTGAGGCTGPTCAAPASLRAGMAMLVLAAAAILALMQ